MQNALILFGLFSLSVLSPLYLEPLANIFGGKNEREILSILDVPLMKNKFKFIKIKDSSGLSVEVYRMKDHHPEKVQSYYFPGAKDALWDLKKETSSLFAVHLDQDAINEIAIPVMDQHLRSELKVLKYLPSTGRFQLYSN